MEGGKKSGERTCLWDTNRSREARKGMWPSATTRATGANAVRCTCVGGDIVEWRMVMRPCVVVRVVVWMIVRRVRSAVVSMRWRANVVMRMMRVVRMRGEVWLGRVLIRRTIMDPVCHAAAAAGVVTNVDMTAYASGVREVERVGCRRRCITIGP